MDRLSEALDFLKRLFEWLLDKAALVLYGPSILAAMTRRFG